MLSETCTWLLDASAELEPLCESPQTAAQVRAVTIDRCGAGAAVLIAAGRIRPATQLLERCVELGDGGEHSKLHAAAIRKPEAFAQAVRAYWLWAASRHDEARELADKLNVGTGPISSFAAHIAEAPTPITRVPRPVPAASSSDSRA